MKLLCIETIISSFKARQAKEYASDKMSEGADAASRKLHESKNAAADKVSFWTIGMNFIYTLKFFFQF